jgi:hypothetical protein
MYIVQRNGYDVKGARGAEERRREGDAETGKGGDWDTEMVRRGGQGRRLRRWVVHSCT